LKAGAIAIYRATLIDIADPIIGMLTGTDH
jgi:hypothetical protein